MRHSAHEEGAATERNGRAITTRSDDVRVRQATASGYRREAARHATRDAGRERRERAPDAGRHRAGAHPRRAALHGASLNEGLRALRLDHDAGAAEQVARWAYGQAERAAGRTWVLGEMFEALSRAWRSVLP